MMQSPSAAKLAVTPANVGSVRTETNGKRASPSRLTAAAVLAICSSATNPSCWRAPPDAAHVISGRRSRRASSHARAIFSPTTEPMLPTKNVMSSTARTTGMPSSCPRPYAHASDSCDRDRSRSSLSR